MSKRSKLNIDENSNSEDCSISVDEKILSSGIDYIIQASASPNISVYHNTPCGSLLYSSPARSPVEIFDYIRHANFTAFRSSMDIYYDEIIRMRNEYGQSVLHVLAIHAHPYVWIRLLMMRGSDMCAQDYDGYTAAHYAVERDDVEMLKALTLRFHAQAKPIPETRIEEIHQRCLEALSVRTKQGLTVFMLACHHESLKCVNYLIEQNINDCHLVDKYGDTCLHYAAARRNEELVAILLDKCKADPNAGDLSRPSVLDVVQYNREQQKVFDRLKDDEIERQLLSHNAKSRCLIRRMNKRKANNGEESITSNLACISLQTTTCPEIETARSHARAASSLHRTGDLAGALEGYKHAMDIVQENNKNEWGDYAFEVAVIYLVRGEKKEALELLHQILNIKKEFDKDSPMIDRIERMISNAGLLSV